MTASQAVAQDSEKTAVFHHSKLQTRAPRLDLVAVMLHYNVIPFPQFHRPHRRRRASENGTLQMNDKARSQRKNPIRSWVIIATAAAAAALIIAVPLAPSALAQGNSAPAAAPAPDA
ncbi:MAG: hypothetical protein WCA56_16165, partial [Xanthobacteraceae bacterium]